jgi:hypothetical protein
VQDLHGTGPWRHGARQSGVAESNGSTSRVTGPSLDELDLGALELAVVPRDVVHAVGVLVVRVVPAAAGRGGR